MLTIKNLKVSESLSEETLAMTCDAYWKGRKLARAHNRGNGEATFAQRVGSVEAMREATTYARAQPVLDLDGQPLVITGEPAMHDLESLIDSIAEDLHYTKKHTARLKRLMKAKTVFIDGVGLYANNRAYTPAVAERIRASSPTAVILNALSIDDAVKLVIKADRDKASQELKEHQRRLG